MCEPFWVESKDGDRAAFFLYRQHYSSRKNPHPSVRLFVGPGEKMVLVGFLCRALFVWRKFMDDSGQQGVNCSVFRNESSNKSSEMIREAMQLASLRWPKERLYTTVDAEATIRRRSKRSRPGECFLRAGWTECGKTKGGLIILEAMPEQLERWAFSLPLVGVTGH